MTKITRFAPSPTGFLHIGGLRTAIFNWLYAKNHDGKFLLRIEDTDRERSTQQAVDAIIEGMKWMGIEWDGEIIFQHQRIKRHQEVAMKLLRDHHAYYCYCSQEELAAMREQSLKSGKTPQYTGMWRDRNPEDAPKGVQPTLRLRCQHHGFTTLSDTVQGKITMDNKQIDDMILLRSDGTPTYMLSVVVDDYDYQITNIIRGSDHLTNTFRQMQIYNALGWHIPKFSHVPLIHGSDGAKFSKRHGALGIKAYKDMGMLPEAMFNYLLRLGWSHADDEIITIQQAIEWFDGTHLGKSSARFDEKKLLATNSHYIKTNPASQLAQLITQDQNISNELMQRLCSGMAGLRQRAKTLLELQAMAQIYLHDKVQEWEEKAITVIQENHRILEQVIELLQHNIDWNKQDVTEIESDIEVAFRSLADKTDTKLGQLAAPVRAALCGKTVSPSVFEMLSVLGKQISLDRLQLALSK